MVGSPLPYESWQMEQPEQLGVVSMEKRIHENKSQHAKTCRKAEVPCLTMGDYVNLCFLVLLSAHQAPSCDVLKWRRMDRQPDNPTTRQPAGTNYQHVYDGLQAVENAPAPNFPVSEPLEPLSCAFVASLSMDSVMFSVSCLFGVVTCWRHAG